MERQIAGGETQSYVIRLEESQFLRTVPNSTDIDLVVELYGQDGRKLLTVDLLKYPSPEPVSFEVTKTGEYRLEIRADAPPETHGNYQATIALKDKANEGDQQRATAERLLIQASELEREGSMESLQKAIDRRGEALSLWRALADRYWEAYSLHSRGRAAWALGRNQEALEFYNQALATRKEIGDGIGEVATLNSIGVVCDGLGQKEKALEYYNQALPMARAVGDRRSEANTLNNLGGVYEDLGEKQKALEYYNQALPLKRAVGDRDGEANTLNNIGSVYDSLGDKQRALEYYNLALPLARAVGDRRGEAITLNNVGSVYDSLGEKQRALEYYNQALLLKRAVGDLRGQAITLNNIGAVYSSLGEHQKALEYYSQSLPMKRAVGDRRGEANTLNNLGSVYDSLGEKQKALEYYNQALWLKRAVGDRGGEANTLHNIGLVYDSLGERQKALEYYNQALPLTRAVGDRRGESNTLNNIGLVYDTLGEKQKALEYYYQALPLRRAVNDRGGEAATLSNIGVVYRSLGEKEKALEYYQQALQLSRAVGDRSGEANTLNNIGFVYDSLGDKQKALEYYNQALLLQRAVGDRRGLANTLGNVMWLWQGDNPSLAAFYGKQAVNVLQQLRANIAGLDKSLQRTFLHSNEDTYRLLADILISHGRLSEAEEALALLKDEEYSSLRSRSDPKTDLGYTPAESEAVKTLNEVGELGREDNELRDRKEKKTLDDKGQQRLEQIERELMPQANARFRVTLAAIEKEAPGTAIKTAEVREGQSLMRYLRELGPGTVALYTVVSTEAGKSSKGWVILVTPSFQKAYEMDVTDLDQTVAAFRQTLRSDSYDPQPLAEKLYHMIFLKPQKEGKTLAEDLEVYLKDQKQKTLMWSLDGVLRYVPMAALHDGKLYLLERYRNEVFTSASLLGLTHPTSREWNALGLGVAKKYEGFSALSGVPQELSAIVKDGSKHTSGVLPGTIKWDDEFKEQSMLDSLSDGYNVVHIASHFSYQAANPEKSFLLLGDGGHLEMSKIQDMNPLFEKTDLVTLSACDTAMGAMKDANGKDVEGFAYVAQKLGAMAVIASLWPVDDVGTQVLMPKFYAMHQNGLSKAEALRQAQLALLNGNANPSRAKEQRSEPLDNETNSSLPRYQKDPAKPYAHPYYWAPFILIGNWK